MRAPKEYFVLVVFVLLVFILTLHLWRFAEEDTPPALQQCIGVGGNWVLQKSIPQLLTVSAWRRALSFAVGFRMLCTIDMAPWEDKDNLTFVNLRNEHRSKPQGVWVREGELQPLPTAKAYECGVRDDHECNRLALFQQRVAGMLGRCRGQDIVFVGDSLIRSLYDTLRLIMGTLDWGGYIPTTNPIRLADNEVLAMMERHNVTVHNRTQLPELHIQFVRDNLLLETTLLNSSWTQTSCATRRKYFIQPWRPLSSLLGQVPKERCRSIFVSLADCLDPEEVRKILPPVLFINAYSHYLHRDSIIVPSYDYKRSNITLDTPEQRRWLYNHTMHDLARLFARVEYTGQLYVVLPVPHHYLRSKWDPRHFNWPEREVQEEAMGHIDGAVYTTMMADAFATHFPQARILDVRCMSIMRPDAHPYRATHNACNKPDWDQSHFCAESVVWAWAEIVMDELCSSNTIVTRHE